jgi:hypothetical protein
VYHQPSSHSGGLSALYLLFCWNLSPLRQKYEGRHYKRGAKTLYKPCPILSVLRLPHGKPCYQDKHCREWKEVAFLIIAIGYARRNNQFETLKCKYVLVTGASRGIEAAIALQLTKEGATGIAVTYLGVESFESAICSDIAFNSLIIGPTTMDSMTAIMDTMPTVPNPRGFTHTLKYQTQHINTYTMRKFPSRITYRLNHRTQHISTPYQTAILKLRG